MGCCKVGNYTFENCDFCLSDKDRAEDSDPKLTPEEIEILAWENEIGFTKIKTRDLTDHLLSASRREIIPENDFIKILTQLNLPSNLDTYKRFKEKSGYSLIKISFSGILLGSGSNEEKLYSLFSLIDINGTCYLSKHDLINAISALVNTSLSVPENSYQSNLVKLKPLAITKLIHEICIYDQCSQSQLRDLLMVKDYWFLFESRSLRNWIKNVGSGGFQVKLTEESTGLPQGQNRVYTESLTSSLSVVSEVCQGNIREVAFSSSSDSNGPICLLVNLSPKEKANFYFYPNEDPFAKALEFSEQYGLSGADKDRLMNSVSKIKNQIV